jgi:RND family efflux transporter MFP subunit
VAIVTLSLFAASCAGEEPARGESAPRPAVNVNLQVAGTTPVPMETEASGVVRPLSRSSPASKIMGRVEVVAVGEGEDVERGVLLVALDKRDLEAAASQARAALAMAEAQFESASAQYERFTDLYQRGSVTARSLEEATAAYRVAGAAVEQARAQVAAAEVRLAYAEIRASVSGLVIERMIEPGDVAVPGAPLLKIDDLSRVKVTIDVPESRAVGLERGDAAEIVVDALGGVFHGKIERIVPALDPSATTVTVEIIVDNPRRELQSGMFARARFQRGAREALMVERTAVVRNGQLDAVFVVGDDSVARLRWVRLGRERGGAVEIISGLEPGERYVADPPLNLVDGSPVQAG